MKNIKIGDREIGEDQPVYIIAEISANHNGNIQEALELIRLAKKIGADAVKIQTYTPDTITINCDNEYFKINQGTIWDGKTLYELYKEAFTPWEWHERLFKEAAEVGITCFSSPFDPTAIDLLESFKVPAYKIASFEITDTPLIKYAASKGKPIIISTGIADEEDIKLAVETCKSVGNENIILLKCTSSYPAPIELANLNMIPDMKNRFGTIVGLSDHTLGEIVPIVATSLGAKIIEKHFIKDKSAGGPDASFSLSVEEFEELIKAVRNVEKSMGQVSYELSDKAKESRNFSRSLFIVQDMKKGEILTDKNIRSIRPGYGLHPKYFHEIVGKTTTTDIKRGTPVSWDLFN